jgi:hypothetical protein
MKNFKRSRAPSPSSKRIKNYWKNHIKKETINKKVSSINFKNKSNSKKFIKIINIYILHIYNV